MKVSRILGSLLSVGALALLAACGGGGGGGGVTPPTGGGGGGGTPPPTATPSPTATATATPTAAPTATPTGSTTIAGGSEMIAYDGDPSSNSSHVNGTDNWQTNGVTVSGDAADGDTASGGNCSAAIDGVGCDLNSESQMTSANYHVHAFVGIWANGQEYALPDGIGMQGAVDNGGAIGSFTAAYDIHTHDASGVVHLEDPNEPASLSTTYPQFNLQTLLDIWGQTYNASGFAGFSGATSVYVGDFSSKDASGRDLVTSYTLYTGALSSLQLQHHRAIWIIVGTPPATLPEIGFGISS